MSQIVTQAGFVADDWQDLFAPDLADYSGQEAVILHPGDDPACLAPYFANLRLIVVTFPSSADGRGFSQAAVLRALGFRGHIRARGHVLVDQLRAALRSGVDDIEITDAQAARNPAAQWQAVVQAEGYQTRVFT